MKLRVPATVSAMFLGALVLAGCSSDAQPGASDGDVVISDDALIATPDLERSAVVGLGTLDFPIAGNEALLARMAAGKVLVGGRSDLPGTKNPEGFLVKIQSVSRDGATAHLTTAPAALNEVIEQGSFGVDMTPLAFSAAGGTSGQAQGNVAKDFEYTATPRDLYTFDETVAGQSGNAHVQGKVSLKEAHVKFSPALSYKANIKKAFGFIPSGLDFQADASGTLDASLDVYAEIAADAQANLKLDYAKTLGGQPVTIFQSGASPLPGAKVGPVNVSSSAALRIDAICTVKDTGGQAHAEGTVKVQGNASAGVKYDGSWSTHYDKTLNATPTLTYDANGEVHVDCKLAAVLSVRLFGAAMADVAIGSYFVFDGQASAATGQPVQGSCNLKAGIHGDFDGKLEVLGFTLAKKHLDLFDETFAPAACSAQPGQDSDAGVGGPSADGGGPAPTPCTGEPDGLYCGNELGGTSSEYYQCHAGNIVQHLQCAKGCTKQGTYAYCLQ